MKCSRCGSTELWQPRLSRLRRSLFTLFRVRALRCARCGALSYRSGSSGDKSGRKSERGEPITSTFLPPEDTRTFDEVIRDIAEQEKLQTLAKARELETKEEQVPTGDPWRTTFRQVRAEELTEEEHVPAKIRR